MSMPTEDQVRAVFARAVREAPELVISTAEIDTYSAFERDVSIVKIEITNELIETMQRPDVIRTRESFGLDA